MKFQVGDRVQSTYPYSNDLRGRTGVISRPFSHAGAWYIVVDDGLPLPGLRPEGCGPDELAFATGYLTLIEPMILSPLEASVREYIRQELGR